ncbi:MAG: hypothetical protein AAGA29_05830 [Planctomycetota bacterium]
MSRTVTPTHLKIWLDIGDAVELTNAATGLTARVVLADTVAGHSARLKVDGGIGVWVREFDRRHLGDLAAMDVSFFCERASEQRARFMLTVPQHIRVVHRPAVKQALKGGVA